MEKFKQKLSSVKGTILKHKKITLIIAIVLVIVGVVSTLIYKNVEYARMLANNPELAKAMTYEEVKDGDENIEGTDNVKFDAFFLRDLNGDGYAESIRGTSKEIGKEDTLYMELNVQTAGYLKDAKITINDGNFYFQTTLPKDDELKDSYIGNNIKTIEFNQLANGTQKMIMGIVRSGDYSYSSRENAAIGNNINNYSKLNTVTLTGTYVGEDGVETPITKTVNFNIDWYGTARASIYTSNSYNTYNDLDDRLDEENGTITLNFSIRTEETEDELILKKNHVEATIPQLNGYDPLTVEYTGSNATANYDEETRTLTIEREAQVGEDGTVTSGLSDNNSYSVKVTYPLEAYQSLGEEAVTIKIPIQTYYEGYNNPSEEFDNPYKSNTATATITANYRKPTPPLPVETKSGFDITVGKYITTPSYRYVVSKQKPLSIYNGLSDKETDDIYQVRWEVYTGTNGESSGIVMKETKDGEAQGVDKFIKTDGSSESMEEVTTNVGIAISGADSLLKEDGWIKVYDEETGNLLVTFTKENWNNYTSSNPYKYELPVKHIRVETSGTNANERMYVYNIKELDDEYITTNYTREAFDDLKYIESTLVGYMNGEYVGRDTHRANYEAPYSIADIGISNNTISTQSTEKNEKLTITARYNSSANQVGWVDGSFVVKLPEEVIDAQINDVQINNSAVSITSYELIEKDGIKLIKINTKNNNETPQTYSITVDVDITPDPREATVTKNIELYATNEEASDYYYNANDTYDVNDNLNTEEKVNYDTASLSMVSPNSLLTNQVGSNYDDKGSQVVSPEVADIKPVYAVVDQDKEKEVTIGVQVRNNYGSTISDIQILGKIPFEGNTYVISGGDLGSTFTTKMKDTGIIVPEELQQYATVYYSENENPDRDLSKAENGWKTAEEVTNWDNVKTFLIDLGNYIMPTGAEYVFNYTVKIPNGLEFNQVSFSHHGVYFSLDTDQGKYRTQTEPNRLGFRIAEKFNLELTKYQTGKDKVIPGATYSITDEETGESKTAVTTANGTLTINNLYAEKAYTIQEIKTPSDYELNSDVIRFIGHVDNEGNLTIEKTSGTTKENIQVIKEEGQDYKVSVKVEDEVKASIKIHKTEQGTDTNIQNVRYKLTGYNLPENGRTVTTNSNGEATISGLSINQEYTLTETKAEGYYLADPITFKIVNNEGSYSIQTISGTGEEQNTGITLNQSTTEEDSMPTITLNFEDEKIPTYALQIIKVKKTIDTTVTDNKTEAQEEIETNNSTEDTNNVMPSGAMQGTPTVMQTNNTINGVGNVAQEGTTQETPSVSEITYLAGVKFKLYKGTEEIGKFETDSTGTVTINNLYQYIEGKDEEATYTLKEVLAPEGYAKVKDITFKVDGTDGSLKLINTDGTNENYTVEGTTVKLTIEDSPSFKLIKKDAETKLPIANVKFAIYNVENGEVPATNSKGEIIGTKETINGKEYYTVQTNANGELTADLTEGLYKAVEVEAPDQYDLEGQEYYFGIGASREAPEGIVAIWEDSFGGDNGVFINSVAGTSDGGAIAGGCFSGSTIQVGNETLTNKGNYDGLIIKYDGEGNVQWAKSFGGSYEDSIYSVTETIDGGVIAGGYFESSTIPVGNEPLTSNGWADGLIIKYDGAGNVQWAKNIGGNSYDRINSVAISSDGGIIAGGYFEGTITIGNETLTNNGEADGLIIKYDEAGNVQWAKNIGGSSYDYIESVATTSDGGVIAGGYFESSTIPVGNEPLTSNGGADGLIIKYDGAGNVQWTKDIGGSRDDRINSVAISSDGGIIAGGYFESSTIQVENEPLTNNGGNDGLIIKYDRAGNVQWAKNIGGSSDDYIYSVASTSDGGAIVGGHFYSKVQIENKTLTEGLIIKYDLNGEIEQVGNCNGSVNSVVSVVETSDEKIIAGFQAKLIKYETQELGNPIVTNVNNLNDIKIESMTSTSDGGYIIGGNFSSRSIQVGNEILTNNGSCDGLIIKYNRFGKVEWAKSFGGDDSDNIYSVSETSDGGIIAGGSFESSTIKVENETLTNNGSTSYSDGLIIKYNSSGELEWAKSYGGSSNDYIKSAAETSDGGILAEGYFEGTITIGNETLTNNGSANGLIIKYNNEGDVEWVKSNLFGESTITSVVITSDGGIIAGGYFYSDEIQVGNETLTNHGGISDGLIIKYNSSGELEWAKNIGGSFWSDEVYIESVASTSDGGIIAGGYFRGDAIYVGNETVKNYSSADTYPDGLIIKYNSSGNVEWAKSTGGDSSDQINSVASTRDGGYIVGVSFNNSITIEGQVFVNAGSWDELIIKYSNEGEVEWVKSFGGNDEDYIQSITEIKDGRIIIGGYFNSESIEVDGNTLENQGGSDGMILEVVNQVGVPEVQELTVENSRKEFKITTDVNEIDGIKGGEITGEDMNPYEKVKYGDSSKKEIVMTPDENYEIIGITVNGEEWPFKANSDGTYTMPQFTNMTEDKHIVVTYALKSNKITINKTDSSTGEKLLGATFEIKSEDGETARVTTNNEGQAITQLVYGKYTITEIEAPQGYELNSTPLKIDFTEGGKHEFTIENNKKAQVIVHHYLKDNKGNYTTTKVAEDELIEQTDKETYTTSPKLDLEKYELEKDEEGNYVIPENAAGSFETGKTIEVIYYYEEKEIPLTVHHYIEGTEEKVPLKDGNVAEDVEDSGKEGENYQTSEIEDSLLSDDYELVETPSNAEGTYRGEEVIVTYYYKRVERKVVINKYDEDGKTALAGVGFTIAKKDSPEEIIGTYTTNEKGQIEVTLESGDYIAKEVTVPENYQIPEDNTTEFSVTKESDVISLDITNTKKKGTVITHYYIEDTEKKVPSKEEGKVVEDVIQTGSVGENYATKESENVAENYEYVKTEGETSGQIKEGTTEVIYYYRLKDPEITEPEITKESSIDKITDVNQKIDYTINYKVKVDKYKGKAEVEIVDNLPYEIDTTKTDITKDLDGGTYNAENKIITWTEEIEDINTFANGIKEIEITKKISLVYKDIDETKENVTNKVEGTIRLETPEKEEKVEDEKDIPTEYLVNIPVTKVWSDKNNEAQKRPESVILKVTGNGQEYTQEINASNKGQDDNTWTYTFTGLPKYDENGDEIKYVVDEEELGTNSEFYQKQVDQETRTITNEFVVPGDKVDVTVTKEWDDNKDKAQKRPESVTLQIKNGDKVVTSEPVTVENAVNGDTNKWSHTFKVPKYDEHGNEINYTADEAKVEGIFYTEENKEISGDMESGYTITNRFEVPDTKIEIPVTKVWEDTEAQQDKRPSTVTVVVKGDNKEEKYELKAEENWEHTFTNLPKYDSLGNEINYTVEEQGTNEFYTYTGTAGDMETGYTITNTFRVPDEKVSVDVSKVWEDTEGQQDKRPSEIQVALNNGTETVETKKLNEANGWKEEFTELPKYDANGNEITYTVEEVTTNKFYTSGITGDMESGYVITNTFTVPKETTEVTVNKVWDDNNNEAQKRPERVTIKVTGNGEEYKATVGESDNWTHTFTDLPKYDANGNEIEYTADEEDLRNMFYSKENVTGDMESGYTITNKFVVPEDKVEITVNKVWEDNDIQSARRPEVITINVIGENNKVVQTYDLKVKEGETSHTFTELPKYNSLGNAINYTVEEQEKNIDDLKFYTNSVSGDMNSGYTITNTFTRPEDTVDIIANKVWNDNEEQSSRRPESIILVVKNGEQEVESKEVSNSNLVAGTTNKWSVEFEGLQKYDENGQEIKYTIEEKEKNSGDLHFYQAEENNVAVEDNQATIRNYFVRPEDVVSVTVTKNWNDSDNVNGRRPTSIKLQVKNGENVVSEQEVSAKNNWTYTFTDLPKYDDNGKEIEYTVAEAEVNSGDLKFYTNDSVSGDIISGYTITNTFKVPDEKVSLTVNKVWKDNAVQSLRRPKVITINVLGESGVVQSYDLNVASETSHTFTDLPKYNSNGKEISYTVEEQEKNIGDLKFYTGVVENVESTSENNKEVTITNTFKVPDEKTNVVVTKVWEDNNDKANKRPTSIKLLLKNGTKTLREQEISSNDAEEGNTNTWSYEFTDLDKYNSNGQEIVYTADEAEINSGDLQFYNKKVSGTTITNTFTQDTTKVEVTVNKVWVDTEAQEARRPESVVIVLKANGEEINRAEVSGENQEDKDNWSYTFKDLPKYDEFNNIINYTVDEAEANKGDLKFYSKAIDGTTITNTFTRPTETISIEVNKKWEDQENRYEKRPVSIKYQVKNGEEVVAEKIVTNKDNWEYTFEGLDKYNEEGQEITYTVDEQEVISGDLYYYEKTAGEVTDKAGSVNVKEATVTNTMVKIPSTVVVKYVDKNTGEEISEAKEKEGIIGEEFDVTEDVKEIPGYTLVEEPEEKKGTYTSEVQEKIYYYAKNTKVIVKYLEKDETEEDSDNKVLSEQIEMSGYEGEGYATNSKQIEGYTLVATKGNLSGTMTREEQVVVYYYAKNTKVIVKYLEKDDTPTDTSDNKVLLPENTIEGYVGKEYKTTEEVIPGYTLVQKTTNYEGVMTEDVIEVVYYYAKNTSVVVKYLEQDDTPDNNDDNTVLAEEIVISGYEGKSYETEKKDIENYTFVEDTENTSGKMTKEQIEVIYYYAQNTKAKVQHIDRETGKILKEETTNGKVGDLFKTHAEDFEGYVLVESPEEPNIIMDKTGTQIVKYYYAHVSAGIIEKHIDEITGELLYSEEHKGNEGDPYNIPSKEFAGYDLVTDKLPENSEGTMLRDEVIEVKYYYIKKATVVVKYVDENTGEEIAKEETIEGHENDSYETQEKQIDDYNLVKTPENASGTMVITKNEDGTYNTEIEVIYYYKKIAGGVKENHIDINTGKKLYTEEHKGNVGDKYEIPSREFEGYDLVTERLPDNSKGTMTEKEIEVNYYYEKQAKVKVEYIDKQTGEKLDEEEIKGHVGDSYETEEKEFDGYDLVEKPSNDKGEMKEEETVVKYYYARKAEVEVKYLEKGTDYEVAEGSTLNGYVGDKYETEQKEIPYYKFIEKTENWKGNMSQEKITVIYYYEKQVFNLGVDKWVSNVNINGIGGAAQNIGNKDEIYKVDIYRKDANTANVKVTYKIRITNKGEIEGTVGRLTDIIPSGYSYNQEDNEIYFENNSGVLTTDALKDEVIQPGEYKEIEVVLRWTGGEGNFGQKDNMVILTQLNNPAGYEDIDKDDNTDTSSMIITVATGLDRNDRIAIIGIVQIVLVITIGLLLSYKKKEKHQDK